MIVFLDYDGNKSWPRASKVCNILEIAKKKLCIDYVHLKESKIFKEFIYLHK